MSKPGPKMTDTQRAEALVIVARLDRAGLHQTEIPEQLAKEIGVRVSQPMIGQYLKRLRAEYKARAIEERDVLVREKCAQLSDVRREAWLAWRRSQEAADDEGGQRAGDARFLNVTLETLRAECELLGLDAPKKSEVITGTFDLGRLLRPPGEDLVEKQIKEIDPPPIIEGGENAEATPAEPPAVGWYADFKPNGKKKKS